MQKQRNIWVRNSHDPGYANLLFSKEFELSKIVLNKNKYNFNTLFDPKEVER